MNLKRIVSGSLTGVLLAAGLWGCGSASNNDQGVSFSLNSMAYPSGTTGNVPFPGGDDVETVGSSGAVNVDLTLQNNMSTQGVRAQRAFYSYYIPGSVVQPPSSAVGFNLALGVNADAVDSSSSSSSSAPSTLPPGFGGSSSIGTATVPAITSSVLSWMVFNRTSLPDLPFDIEVTATVRGTTTAGDVLDTNAATLSYTMTPDIIIPGNSSSSSSSSSSEE